MGIQRLFIEGETATMFRMPLPQFFLQSADPAETKEIATLQGGLEGQVVTVTDLVAAMSTSADAAVHTLEALRAYTKHRVEAIEPFLPGGRVYLEEFYEPNVSPDLLVESVKRAGLWGRDVTLVLPITLSSIEAMHLLSRTGASIAVGPICSIDQAAAVLAATREATAPVVLMIPIDTLASHGVPGEPVVAAVLQFARAAAMPVTVMVEVQSLASLRWGVAAGVPAIAAPAAVLRQFAAEGEGAPRAPLGESERALVLSAEPSINLDVEQQSFALSHEVSDLYLTQNTATWKQMLE